MLIAKQLLQQSCDPETKVSGLDSTGVHFMKVLVFRPGLKVLVRPGLKTQYEVLCLESRCQVLNYIPFIKWTVFTQIKPNFTFTAFVVNAVFCHANTTEMSDNINGCLLTLIQQWLMFINLYLCGLNECSQ